MPIDLTINLPLVISLLITASSVLFAAGRLAQKISNVVDELDLLDKTLRAHEQRLNDHNGRISNIEGRCLAMHQRDDFK